VTSHEIKTASFLAYKAITKGHRSTSLLLIFILSLTFLNMLFVSGMLFGLQKLMVNSIIDLFSSHVTVSSQQEPRVRAYIDDQADVRAAIAAIPGVIATARHYQLAGSIGYDKLKNGVYRHISGAIVAIEPEEERKVLHLDRYLLDGTWLDHADRDQIVLSSALAGGYGIFAPSDLGGARVGDKVRLTYANGLTRQYTIKGIYNDAIGLFETFITVDEAESVLSTHNQATQVLVKADLGHAPLDTLVARISEAVPSLRVQPYTVLLGSFAAFLRALDLIAAIVSAISVLVATVTMFVLVYVNAINRRRQIALLKAIGIDQRILELSYVLQSLFYAACGIVIGNLFVTFALIPYLQSHPIDVVFGSLTLVREETTAVWGMVSLIASSLLAGLIPSWAVARTDILKSLSL
jgi:putative ABC transport system permease protein